jgi:hypothetical protein
MIDDYLYYVMVVVVVVRPKKKILIICLDKKCLWIFTPTARSVNDIDILRLSCKSLFKKWLEKIDILIKKKKGSTVLVKLHQQ